MRQLALLGDSVIDNGPYVAAGEPDVAAQVRAMLPGWEVASRAVDGHCVPDTLAALLADPLPDGVPVFLSAGGNDALQHVGMLTDPAVAPMAACMVRMREVRAVFAGAFGPLLDALQGRPVLVATIYNPNFTGSEAALQAPAEGALPVFNDAIQAEALARRMAVLDLRRIFTGAGDYANPIEPSAAGGAKLAAAVADWALAL